MSAHGSIAVLAGAALIVAAIAASQRTGRADEMAALQQPCPGATAHITVHDYAGPFVFDFCVDPNGIRYTGGQLFVSGGDPFADGIFRNGFEGNP